jgi:transposase-like protein
MFVIGTSTHQVGEVAQTLLAVAPSASAISRLNQNLTQQYQDWRQHPLHEQWRVSTWTACIFARFFLNCYLASCTVCPVWKL